ncbi:hypothetical protein PQX77_005379 [Marasmius sp. AFHP31]|nr:hypothetical protein PQX77_005379 [Marasmius sp. AFHP31]
MPLSESEVIGLLQHTPSLHTFILHELWASGDYRDNLNRRQKWKSKLEPQYQIVTKTFLEKLGALTVVADPFAATQYLLVPRLKTLKLGVHSHFDGDDTFVDFVKSRWMQADGDVGLNEVKRLRTVVLHIADRKLVEKVYEPLKRVDREGMMISVFGDGVRVI